MLIHLRGAFILALLLAFSGITNQSLAQQTSSANLLLDQRKFDARINFGIEKIKGESSESSYLKGYMDGVDNDFYSMNKLYEGTESTDAYIKGFSDGVADYEIYENNKCASIKERKDRFSFADYYYPKYAALQWLEDLSYSYVDLDNSVRCQAKKIASAPFGSSKVNKSDLKFVKVRKENPRELDTGLTAFQAFIRANNLEEKTVWLDESDNDPKNLKLKREIIRKLRLNNTQKLNSQVQRSKTRNTVSGIRTNKNKGNKSENAKQVDQ